MSDIDWNHYSLVGHTETWKVVCLSLGINPKDVEVETDHYATMLSNPIQKITPKRNKYKGDLTQKEIDNRYEIIEKRKFDGDYYYNDYTIDIEKFVKFANQIKISLPYEFKNLFEVQSITSNKEEATKPTVAGNTLRLNRPKRTRDYNVGLHNAVTILFEKNKQVPSGLEVLEVWRNEKPSEIFEVLNKSFKYLNEFGEVKEVDMANLNKAISRLFETD